MYIYIYIERERDVYMSCCQNICLSTFRYTEFYIISHRSTKNIKAYPKTQLIHPNYISIAHFKRTQYFP